jgi:hypothetical protein
VGKPVCVLVRRTGACSRSGAREALLQQLALFFMLRYILLASMKVSIDVQNDVGLDD